MSYKIKRLLRLFLPPILTKILRKINNNKTITQINARNSNIILDSSKQDLNLYWDPEFAKILETWGEDNAWNEIQLLLVNCQGKVLDIACGTGITMQKLSKFSNLDIHGCDISDLLIDRAIAKDISKENLKVTDATKPDYNDNEFDYSYSIGSLEHFTEAGIDQFLKECASYTKIASFHMIPISRNNLNNGWIKTTQSYFNNSEEWWLVKYNKHFSKVYSIPSKWEDSLSLGRWFVCEK